MTFGFVKRTGVDWVSWVADRSRELERFRHDLDRWATTTDRSAQESDLVAGMSRLLADYPVSVYLAAREQERQPPRHVVTGGVFGPPAAVVCVTEFPPRIELREQGVEVLAAGKKITFAAKVETALRLLLSGRPVVLATVTAITGIDADMLAETLIKEGMCAELTEALSSGYTGMIPTDSCSNTH
jgi:hypothetical protein